jgi:hypothetical protein
MASAMADVVVAGCAGRLFLGLIYYLIYFPWAWWLERERGWTLLHAAAVTAPAGSGSWGPQNGVLFSGLPGCGKSTTTLAFLNQPEWQIVSITSCSPMVSGFCLC